MRMYIATIVCTKVVLSKNQASKYQYHVKYVHMNSFIYVTKSPSGARLLGSGTSGLLNFVLHALRALRLFDPRNGEMIE